MSDIKIGKITHFFDRIGVAVVDLIGPLTAGDTIRISGHENEFTQKVSSIQVEHQDLKTADKGDTVGLKLDQPAKEGDEIYKV